MQTPTYAGGIEATRPGCATGKLPIAHRRALPASCAANLRGASVAMTAVREVLVDFYHTHGLTPRASLTQIE